MDLVIRSRDELQAYSPLALVLLRPPLHAASHPPTDPQRFLAMIKGPTLAVVCHPLSPYPFRYLTCPSQESLLWQVSPFLPQKAQTRVFSLPPDVRCLTVLGPLIPRSHPLTFLYMFRTNVLDLTRDNRASIPFLSCRSYRLVFVCLVNLFVIVNRRSQSMLLLLVDTTADAFDRPTVCLSHALLPHTPKVVRLFHFLASLSLPRLIVTCSGAHPDPPSLLAARCMNPSTKSNFFFAKANQLTVDHPSIFIFIS